MTWAVSLVGSPASRFGQKAVVRKMWEQGRVNTSTFGLLDQRRIRMAVGRFLAMVGILVWRRMDSKYLVLQRSPTRDWAAGGVGVRIRPAGAR